MTAYLNQDVALEDVPTLVAEYKDVEITELVEQLKNDVETILSNIDWNHLQYYIQLNYDGRYLTIDEVKYLMQTIREGLR